MKLIVNADDFGFSESVNYGIMDAYKSGIVTSTTMMMNMPGVEHAFRLYKENQGIGLGIHLNLTAGRPLAKDVPSLIKENGDFYYIDEIEEHIKREDAYIELKTQIEKFISFGVQPTHLDIHHYIQTHAHKFKNVMKAVYDLVIEYNLPIRILNEEDKKEARSRGIKTPDYISLDFYSENALAKTIENALRLLPNDCITEIMTHPGYMDEETIKRTSYNVQREQEIRELIKLKDSAVLRELGVEFVNYGVLGRY